MHSLLARFLSVSLNIRDSSACLGHMIDVSRKLIHTWTGKDMEKKEDIIRNRKKQKERKAISVNKDNLVGL